MKYSIIQLAVVFHYESPYNKAANKPCFTCQRALSFIIAVTSSVQLSISTWHFQFTEQGHVPSYGREVALQNDLYVYLGFLSKKIKNAPLRL